MRQFWPSSSAYLMMFKNSERLVAGRGVSFPLKGVVLAVVAGALAGCAQPQYSQRSASSRSKEYFSSSMYGPASRRVIADGQPVPRGGGQYLVGRPYSVAGRRYYPSEQPHESQIGMASYYGAAFHGRRTANGEIYDMSSISAAHPTMPLPSYARVTNLHNGRSIVVRVNDRGPYHGGRVLDVSERTAELLDFKRMGTAQIKVDYIGRASLDGSDDRMLFASLRTDGAPATIDGSGSGPVMVASETPVVPPRPAPQRVAEVTAVRREEPVAEEMSVTEKAPEREARSAPMPTNAPMPPNRPFDLGTIPGAGVPIAAPRPPVRQASTVTFFADPHAPTSSGAHRGPFDRLDAAVRASAQLKTD